jgi:hypothetical protein
MHLRFRQGPHCPRSRCRLPPDGANQFAGGSCTPLKPSTFSRRTISPIRTYNGHCVTTGVSQPSESPARMMSIARESPGPGMTSLRLRSAADGNGTTARTSRLSALSMCVVINKRLTPAALPFERASGASARETSSFAAPATLGSSLWTNIWPAITTASSSGRAEHL